MRMLIAVAALSVASLPTLAAGAPGRRTHVGCISDHTCAMSGAKAKRAAEWIKPAAFETCVKTCVKDGSDAVLVTEGNRILTLDQASAKITPLLDRTVSVTGRITDRTLEVDGITGLEM